MSAGQRTVATVVRAGPRTALVSLSGWHCGQILAPVAVRVLTASGGQVVPGSRYWVTGNLTAMLDHGLALRDWEPVSLG